jgi:hypothetical protein
MSLENFIITVFCLVVENVDQILTEQKLRLRGFAPKLTDAEVISMEIIGEFLGIDTDKGIWLYFKTHWQDWFPALGSRSSFVRQASNLWQLKQKLQSITAKQLNAENDSLHMADGFPLPVCKFKRAHFSRIFEGFAAYGYCASKAETYYGFKGNVAINSAGVISNITVAPANIDERESLWEIVGNIKGLLFADKGLIGADFQKQLQAETGVNLQTPMRNNMDDPRGKDANSWLISTRRLVETVIGQLSERFNIEKNWARDLWHFTNRIFRKILSHTMAIFINKMMGNQPLQFDNLVKVS